MHSFFNFYILNNKQLFYICKYFNTTLAINNIIKIKFITAIALFILGLCSIDCFAQKKQTKPKPQDLPPQLRPPHPPEKTEQRYIIDIKRNSEDVNGEDALVRSRELKRIDSTYYVGWLFEGSYKYNHSADYIGYKNATIPLERALNLLEHDYSKALATRSDNLLTYYPVYVFQVDYTMIAYYLMNCYSNTDQPDKVFTLLRRTLKWKFQFQFYMDSYNYMAWTVHRNRFYTSNKYYFLKNTIEENEKLANSYLDSALLSIEKNRHLNKNIDPSKEEAEKMSVYHYKNILYSYSFNIDSAQYYFDLMRYQGRLPHNNYATFRVVCGDFATAEHEYNIASTMDAGDKRLQEWAYYTSILDIYKGKTKKGIELSKNMIKAAGSTPGFGWYNIALARCMLYDGQINEAQRFITKAAEFKELHIGTTLGQSHYDFSIQLLKLINKEQELEMQKFENKNWFLNPSLMLNMSKLKGEIYMQQFLIINQFALNPERDRVIYKLFSNESTVSWDEIWYLIHDFSTRFFIDRFQKEAETDKRKYINKYFELFVAKLKMQQNKYDESKKILDKILSAPEIDIEYEKLFIARVYQAEAECALIKKDKYAYNQWIYKLYLIYPQLVPFSGIQMNMKLHTFGDNKEILSKLHSMNINWISENDIPAPEVYITFSAKGGKKEISYYVIDKMGNYIVKKQTFNWQKEEEASKELAYRLFNIGGATEEKIEKEERK